MSRGEPTRRRTLSLAAAAASAGLTGCLTDAPWTQEADGGDGDQQGDDGSSGDGVDDGHDEGDDGAHDHGVDDTIGHPESHAEVKMVTDEDGHHFVPHVVHVERGGTVEWILESGAHDTVAYHPDNASRLPSAAEQRIPEGAAPWASEIYDRGGASFDLVFEEEGVYDYVCTVSGYGHMDHMDEDHHPSHESTGMVGRVIVGEPELDPEHQPAMQPPSSELPEAARHELEGFTERTRQALGAEDGH